MNPDEISEPIFASTQEAQESYDALIAQRISEAEESGVTGAIAEWEKENLLSPPPGRDTMSVGETAEYLADIAEVLAQEQKEKGEEEERKKQDEVTVDPTEYKKIASRIVREMSKIGKGGEYIRFLDGVNLADLELEEDEEEREGAEKKEEAPPSGTTLHELREVLDTLSVSEKAKEFPFWGAAYRGDLSAVVKELETYPEVNVNWKTSEAMEFSALHLAAAADKADVVEFLLKQPGILVNIRDFYENTPLTLACEQGWCQSAKLLLAHPGIDVNPLNFFGITPMMYAITQGDMEAVKAFIRAGISAKDAKEVCNFSDYKVWIEKKEMSSEERKELKRRTVEVCLFLEKFSADPDGVRDQLDAEIATLPTPLG